MTRTSHLALLGLSMSADTVAIKARYRELAKLHHPDINANADANEFLDITNAYHALLKEPSEATGPVGGGQGPAMDARWNIKRRHSATEYPAWFTPPDGKKGDRGLHTTTAPATLRRLLAVARTMRYI